MARTRWGLDILLCLCLSVCGAGEAQARFLSSQDADHSPRSRVACHPCPTLGTHYQDPSRLGSHRYGFSLWERSGIVYTRRGGHIDIVHVRKAADWTAHLAHKSREVLLKSQDSLSFRMREPSEYHVQIEYPKGWRSLPPEVKEQIATEVAVQLGQYFAYTGTTWHEILTWFGFKSTGFYSEYPSAFSWEDNFSNLLGTRIGASALQDPDHEYDEAVTLILNQELKALGVQSGDVAWQAGEAVRDQWFITRFIFCDMIKRNFDIGTDDGFVTGWPVPGIAGLEDPEPASYPIPDLAALDRYGFSFKLEIEPKEWERKKILQIVYPDLRDGENRVEPAKHFGPIVEYIRAQAARRYGPQVDQYSVLPEQTSQPFTATSAELGRRVAAADTSGPGI